VGGQQEKHTEKDRMRKGGECTSRGSKHSDESTAEMNRKCAGKNDYWEASWKRREDLNKREQTDKGALAKVLVGENT